MVIDVFCDVVKFGFGGIGLIVYVLGVDVVGKIGI